MLRAFASTCMMVGILIAGAGATGAQTTTDPHHPEAPASEKKAEPQPKPPGGMMGSGMMGRMMGAGQTDMMGGCQMAAGGATHTEGRIAFLRAELGITDSQKAVWDAYAVQIKQNLQSMQDMPKMMAAMMDVKTPLERIDARIAMMEKRAQALKEIKPALVALYAALSAEQKVKADQILTGMGCMM